MHDLLMSWPGGSIASTIKLLVLLLGSYVLVLWLSAIVWTYRDVRNRTSDITSQIVAVLLVGLFNAPGLVVYLVIRPQTTLADAYERSLEAEAMLHELQATANSCQNCRRPVEDDFNVCPHCRAVLREACRSCGRPIRTNWITCPYCATDRAPARTDGTAASSPLAPPRRSGVRAGETIVTPPPTRPAVPREG